jgi:hypothetical protein
MKKKTDICIIEFVTTQHLNLKQELQVFFDVLKEIIR